MSQLTSSRREDNNNVGTIIKLQSNARFGSVNTVMKLNWDAGGGYVLDESPYFDRMQMEQPVNDYSESKDSKDHKGSDIKLPVLNQDSAEKYRNK